MWMSPNLCATKSDKVLAPGTQHLPGSITTQVHYYRGYIFLMSLRPPLAYVTETTREAILNVCGVVSLGNNETREI